MMNRSQRLIPWLLLPVSAGLLSITMMSRSSEDNSTEDNSTEDKNETVQSVEVESLRGPTEITSESTPPALAKFPRERIKPNLQYIGQPPVIPHTIRGYEIHINSNKCLMCHSWENAVKMRATRISITHFMDRDGTVLADVSPTRYHCTQCHVQQVNAKPLVPNLFEPVESLKQP